jgi:hypothetical protein
MLVCKRLLRRGIAVGLAVLVLVPAAAFARGEPPSAKDFLATIYQFYVGSSVEQAKGVPLDTPTTIRRYFSPGLASLILDEGMPKAGAALVLGADPFVGRDKWQITDLAIAVKESGPTKAFGTVTFTNFGQPEKVVIELLKVGDEWRIAEINWGALTLRGLYRKKWQAVVETTGSAR